MNYPKLTQETILLNTGHTAGVLIKNDKVYCYVGAVDFSGITLYKGNDIYHLEHQTKLFSDRRWATVLNDGDSIHLFCTYHTNNEHNIFDDQNIYWYMSANGINFTPKRIITNGSAPWVTKENGIYYLFYHRKTDLTHDILVRQTRDILNLHNSQELTVGTCPITHQNYAWSAPSIIKIGDIYWMSTEFRCQAEPWRTIIGYSRDILGPYHTHRELLYGWRACCFQYYINDKLHLLYSVKKDNMWKLAERHQI